MRILRSVILTLGLTVGLLGLASATSACGGKDKGADEPKANPCGNPRADKNPCKDPDKPDEEKEWKMPRTGW